MYLICLDFHFQWTDDLDNNIVSLKNKKPLKTVRPECKHFTKLLNANANQNVEVRQMDGRTDRRTTPTHRPELFCFEQMQTTRPPTIVARHALVFILFFVHSSRSDENGSGDRSGACDDSPPTYQAKPNVSRTWVLDKPRILIEFDTPRWNGRIFNGSLNILIIIGLTVTRTTRKLFMFLPTSY